VDPLKLVIGVVVFVDDDHNHGYRTWKNLQSADASARTGNVR